MTHYVKREHSSAANDNGVVAIWGDLEMTKLWISSEQMIVCLFSEYIKIIKYTILLWLNNKH